MSILSWFKRNSKKKQELKGDKLYHAIANAEGGKEKLDRLINNNVPFRVVIDGTVYKVSTTPEYLGLPEVKVLD